MRFGSSAVNQPVQVLGGVIGVEQVTISLPQTGGNVTVPTGERWRVVACETAHTLSAVAGNRTILALVTIDATVNIQLHPTTLFPAASVQRVFWMGTGVAEFADPNGHIIYPAPFPMVLDDGDKISFSIQNAQAGDTFNLMAITRERFLL